MTDNQNNHSPFSLLANIITRWAKHFVYLIELIVLEGKLAGKTLLAIIILLIINLIFILTSWIWISILGFFIFKHFNFTNLQSAAMIAVINVILSISILLLMMHMKKFLFFPSTRRQLAIFTNSAEKPDV